MKIEYVKKVLDFFRKAIREYTAEEILDGIDSFYTWDYDTEGKVWIHFKSEDGKRYFRWLRLEELVEWANKRIYK